MSRCQDSPLKNDSADLLKLIQLSPVNPEDFSVVLRARKRIEEGEEIAIHYVSPMQGLLRRKQSIEEEWFFKCRCQHTVKEPK